MTDIIKSEIQQLQPSEYVELWQLDTTLYSGQVYYFVVASVENEPIVWNGITYNPFDIQCTGFEWNTQGPVPTPKLSMSTTNQVITGLINSYNDLLGCKVTRIRTFRKFMDGQSSANPNEYLASDVYVINTKSSETRTQVDFELSSYMDQRGLQLPYGTVTTYCRAIYRLPTGSNTGNPSVDFKYNPSDVACPYQGTSYWDDTDTSQTNPTLDACSHQITGCRNRFGSGEIPIMAFPGSAAPNVGSS
jgi:lambda family phage minor tail protein L